MATPGRGGGTPGIEEGLGGGAQAKAEDSRRGRAGWARGGLATGRAGEPRRRATPTGVPGAARPVAPGASGVHPEGAGSHRGRGHVQDEAPGAARLQGPRSHSAHRDVLPGLRLRVPSRRGRRHHRPTPNRGALRFSSCFQGVNWGASGGPPHPDLSRYFLHFRMIDN